MNILLINWNAVGAIATVITLIVTTLALCFTIYFSWQNRKMLIESREARLVFSIISQNRNLFLKVKNVGQNLAHSIQFEMNEEFINCIPLKSPYEDAKNNSFRLSGGDETFFYILPLDRNSSLYLLSGEIFNSNELNKMKEKFDSLEITIKGQFIDGIYSKTIVIEEKFHTKEYMPLSVAIPDSILNTLRDIKNYLIKK